MTDDKVKRVVDAIINADLGPNGGVHPNSVQASNMARAAIAECERWLPIEDAPTKDGNRFLAWDRGLVFVAFYKPNKISNAVRAKTLQVVCRHNRYTAAGGWFTPTRYLPLPVPPKEADTLPDIQERQARDRQQRLVKEANDLRTVANELANEMQCSCDLDNWEPERTTGHSWVCRIHKAALQRQRAPKEAKEAEEGT